MEQLKQVLKELNLVDVDVYQIDDTQQENIKDMINEKIDEELEELQPGSNCPEFVLDSVLPALKLYHQALYQLGNPTILFEHVRVDYGDLGEAKIYYRGNMISLDEGKIGEHLAAGDNLCVFIGDTQLFLTPENLDEIISTIYRIEEEINKAADNIEPTPMSVEKFMYDYGLWAGQCSIEGLNSEHLTPRTYVESFVEMAWLPTREEMYNFLERFSSDKDELNAWIDETFVWDEEDKPDA